MKHTYTVQTFYCGSWMSLFSETRDFCLGYLDAKKDYAPRNAYRIMRSDGKITLELPSVEDVAIGQIASYPTAEQYELAANRALQQAQRIRVAQSTRK